MPANKTITVFEHQSLKVGQMENFDEDVRMALEKYYGRGDKPYFSLIHNGIKFNEYVGVLQIGDTTIEILPKADKANNGSTDKAYWRNILIDMMSTVDMFDVQAPSSSKLKVKANSILDLYFGLFVQEVEYLLHAGLVKQYRKKEANLNSLKGSLLFSKHIQKNLVHKERFYVRQTTYDVEHKLHFVLYKTIKLLNQINTNVDFKSRIGSLLLFFPEMPDIKVSEALFDRISFNRKTMPYERAIGIAKMILLHYHPDLSSGRSHVLALMFDMNLLWEKFVYHCLKKNQKDGWVVKKQSTKNFWQPVNGKKSTIRPDIVIQTEDSCVVLDTKWKNLNGNPSSEDLRQLYVYHQFYDAKKVALVYPGEGSSSNGHYYNHDQRDLNRDMECGVLTLSVKTKDKNWQEEISNNVKSFMDGGN